MIKSFKNKGLKELFETGASGRINDKIARRTLRRLAQLDQAVRPEEMNAPGFDFHALRGKPQRYTVHVNGPWCVTFEWEGQDAIRVDLEQYH